MCVIHKKVSVGSFCQHTLFYSAKPFVENSFSNLCWEKLCVVRRGSRLRRQGLLKVELTPSAKVAITSIY
jgi:hypothetical protein